MRWISKLAEALEREERQREETARPARNLTDDAEACEAALRSWQRHVERDSTRLQTVRRTVRHALRDAKTEASTTD